MDRSPHRGTRTVPLAYAWRRYGARPAWRARVRSDAAHLQAPGGRTATFCHGTPSAPPCRGTPPLLPRWDRVVYLTRALTLSAPSPPPQAFYLVPLPHMVFIRIVWAGRDIGLTAEAWRRQ